MPGRFLHSFAKPTREDFISIERGKGALLWDRNGRQLIDGIASLWYCQIGHGRADMADAISKQVNTLEAYSVFDPFTNPMADAAAERIASLAPLPGARVFLCCSGSESIDSAMKLARVAQIQAGHPERTIIITRGRGYHGTNYGGTSAQGIPLNKVGYGTLLEGVVQVDADDSEAMSVVMAENSGRIAAVITEPVQGAGGVYPPPEGYLAALRRLCDQHGAYLVFDEVITGFGRLGEWFGATYFGVIPDMITFAKGVTSGYQPVGGVVVGKTVCDALEADNGFFLRHGYTYSGHATGCAAALKNLDIIEQEDLLSRARHVGSRLETGLRALAADGLIAGVRGSVAIWAAELHEGQDSTAIRDRMIDLGAVIRSIPGCNAFCPPLVITDEQIDSMLDIFATAVAEMR